MSSKGFEPQKTYYSITAYTTVFLEKHVSKKGKGRPCTGTEALYRPYGHPCTGTEALYRPYGS
jgi:hypothetical protein